MMKYVLRGYSWAALAICLVTLVIHLIAYRYLPKTIPYHWNLYGQVDSTGSKHIIFLLALIPLFIYLLLVIIPRIDPKREAYTKHTKAYSVFLLVLVTFMSLITIIILFASLGYQIKIAATMGTLLGILLLFIGNYMGQIRPNFLFGIRTPWTLVSEQNWRKTHRLGGPLFAGVGVWLIIGALLNSPIITFIGAIMILVVAVVLYFYSYLTYRQDNK